MKKIAIISTGSELMYGNVHEANCHFISSELFRTDFRVILHITVGDEIEELEYAVKEAVKKADIAIITGGLGPTDDDHTLNILQAIYNFETVLYEPGRKKMEEIFKSINRTVSASDLRQVTVPKNAVIFDNDVGLASGFAYTENKSTIIAMPGVPSEMKNMFENKVLPYLQQKYSSETKKSLTIRTVLIREAEVNNLLKDMNIEVDNIVWGITTEWGMNTVTFVQKGNLEFPADKIYKESIRIFGDCLLSQESLNLETDLVYLLKEKKMTLSIAESCTGGLAAKRITDVPGSSEVFLGGVIAYNNSAKKKMLDVSEDSLNNYGAVSEAVAKEMAIGVRDKFNSSISISITGIAGPSGGSVENL